MLVITSRAFDKKVKLHVFIAKVYEYVLQLKYNYYKLQYLKVLHKMCI